MGRNDNPRMNSFFSIRRLETRVKGEGSMRREPEETPRGEGCGGYIRVC